MSFLALLVSLAYASDPVSILSLPGLGKPISFTTPRLFGACGLAITTKYVYVYKATGNSWNVTNRYSTSGFLANPSRKVSSAYVMVTPNTANAYVVVGDNAGGISFSLTTGCDNPFVFQVCFCFRPLVVCAHLCCRLEL
jgi:hypothetical protein